MVGTYRKRDEGNGEDDRMERAQLQKEEGKTNTRRERNAVLYDLRVKSVRDWKNQANDRKACRARSLNCRPKWHVKNYSCIHRYKVASTTFRENEMRTGCVSLRYNHWNILLRKKISFCTFYGLSFLISSALCAIIIHIFNIETMIKKSKINQVEGSSHFCS